MSRLLSRGDHRRRDEALERRAFELRNCRGARRSRRPAVGSVLTRIHGTTEHRVTVVDDGFDYRGERYRWLSKIARVITGTVGNGYPIFFGRATGT